jgi:serine/threonine-protein kinase
VPAHIAHAIDRALSKRPEDRWSTAQDFRDALAGTVRDERPKARSGLVPPSEPGPLKVFDALGVSVVVATDNDWQSVLPRGGLTKAELARLKREQRRQERVTRNVPEPLPVLDTVLADEADVADDLDWGKVARRPYDARPLVWRVIAFRQSVVRFALGTPALLGINAGMGGDPWFFIPSGILLFDAIRRGGSIWSDGVGPFDAFRKGIKTKLRARQLAARAARAGSPGLPGAPAAIAPHPAERAVSREVIDGAYGDVVRRAFEDRRAIQEIVGSLGDIDREMLPDVSSTVDGLTERIAALCSSLHRLEADVSGNSLTTLDGRIAALEREPASPERDRRVALLQRQRASLNDLVQRRDSLSHQLESATLVLQTLKLDLMKLRSGGVGAALADVTTATQEARAVSRDIGRVIEVADDLRKI